jgi:hypothetical protein
MTERSTRQQQRYNPSTSIALESFLVDVVPEVHYIVVPRTTHVCDECYVYHWTGYYQLHIYNIHPYIHIYIHNLMLHFSRIMHNSMFDYNIRKHFDPFCNKSKNNMMPHPVLMLMQYSHPTIWQIQH